MSIPKLPEEKAIWAADQFIEYYSKFKRIDDYLRFVKESRISKSSSKLFGPEDDIFSDFHIHPNDMDFSIHVVDTSSKPTTKYNQELYSEILHDTASNPIEEAIPGRTLKWIVVENTTNKVVGVIRFGSPTINSKPRNNYFKEVIPLSKINKENYLLCVGRLEKLKGFHHAIKAFAGIVKKYPYLRLKIVGKGSEEKNLKQRNKY